eukprot:scaffold36324_cov141-Isochrysis_galbana.AAC.1
MAAGGEAAVPIAMVAMAEAGTPQLARAIAGGALGAIPACGRGRAAEGRHGDAERGRDSGERRRDRGVAGAGHSGRRARSSSSAWPHLRSRSLQSRGRSPSRGWRHGDAERGSGERRRDSGGPRAPGGGRSRGRSSSAESRARRAARVDDARSPSNDHRRRDD